MLIYPVRNHTMNATDYTLKDQNVPITGGLGFIGPNLAQRLVDMAIYTYAVGCSRWMIEVLSLLLAPVLMMGYGWTNYPASGAIPWTM